MICDQSLTVWMGMWIFCGFITVRFASGLSQSAAGRFGTSCLIHCLIRLSSLDVFRRDLKTHFFAGHWRHERIRGVTVSRNRAIQIDICLLTYVTLSGDLLWPQSRATELKKNIKLKQDCHVFLEKNLETWTSRGIEKQSRKSRGKLSLLRREILRLQFSQQLLMW